MFILNTEIEVNWIFPASVNPYIHTDFDVIVKKPNGSTDYIEGSTEPGGAIKEADYIAPTDSTTGAITYRLTPDQKGVWVIILTIGGDTDSTVYHEYFLRVSEPDTKIYQRVTV